MIGQRTVAPPAQAPLQQRVVAAVALPTEGEALITANTFAAALDISASTLWDWLKNDPDFPQPVRRGERFTRFKLSEARGYIAGMSSGSRKLSPVERKRAAAAVEGIAS